MCKKFHTIGAASALSIPPALLLIVLTLFIIVPATAQNSSIAELLLRDDIQQAERVLDTQPRTAESIAFRGEIEFRKGHFEEARRLYEQAVQMDSKLARAHFGLAKLALGKMKVKTAMQELTRAIQVDPKESLYHLYASDAWGMDKNYAEQRKHLEEYLRLNPNDEDRVTEAKAGLETLKALGSRGIGTVDAPDNPAPIRFKTSLNLIFATVKINGKGPYDFAVDTGATQTVISEKLATELGLEPITSTVVFGIGGTGKVPTTLYKIKELGLGDVTVKNIPAGTFNDPLVSQLADGILGTSALSDFAITVDYPGNQLLLTRKRAAAPSAAEVMPAWFFSNIVLLPLDVNGKRGNFIVDTGAVTTVLSHAMAAELGVNENTPGAKVDLGIAGVGGFQGVVLKVPNVTLKTAKTTEIFPQLVAIDLKQISKMVGTEVAGVVGYDFLSEYRLIIDYEAGSLLLAK